MRTMLSGRRLVLLLLLAAVPVAVASIIALTGEDVDDTEGFVNGLLDATIIAAILPIVTMALATAAFGDEVEDRTLSYLVLKPIPRFHIVMPKLIASIRPLTNPSVSSTSSPAAARMPATATGTIASSSSSTKRRPLNIVRSDNPSTGLI